MSQELLRLVGESAAVTDEQVEALDLDQAELELIDAIASAPVPTRRHLDRPAGPGWLRGRRFALRVGVAVAAIAITALVLVGGGRGGDDGSGVAYAAEWIRIAQENPRLLVTEPGWEVTRADEDKRDYGEMTFTDGTAELDLHWRPSEQYRSFFRDRSYDAEVSKITLLGREATVFDSGMGTYSVMLRTGGETFIEIRGDDKRRLDQEEFLALLETIEAVDVETWLGALPAEVVRPVERSVVVDEMLEGIPIPDGFDVGPLKRGATVRDRYQLGATVSGAVTCAWLKQRVAGLRAGDGAAVSEAEQALATAGTWPILLEMQGEGGWSQEVWDWAEDGRGSSGFGRNTTENPASSLGCPPHEWRDVPRIDPRFR